MNSGGIFTVRNAFDLQRKREGLRLKGERISLLPLDGKK